MRDEEIGHTTKDHADMRKQVREKSECPYANTSYALDEMDPESLHLSKVT